MEIAICITLLITNAATIFWALKYRKPVKVSRQLKALQKVIAAFEVEGQTILHITRVNPDNVFLKAPSR